MQRHTKKASDSALVQRGIQLPSLHVGFLFPERTPGSACELEAGQGESTVSAKGLTPTRKAVLEARVQCIKRSEKRIVLAGNMARGHRFAPDYKLAESARTKRISRYMKRGEWERYAVALQMLRIARSRAAAELEGKLW